MVSHNQQVTESGITDYVTSKSSGLTLTEHIRRRRKATHHQLPFVEIAVGTFTNVLSLSCRTYFIDGNCYISSDPDRKKALPCNMEEYRERYYCAPWFPLLWISVVLVILASQLLV